jgi:hypothetical protein
MADKITFNCPSCGSPLQRRFQFSKFIVCEYCRVSLVLEDEAVHNAGYASVSMDIPSILELNKQFEYRGWKFIPIGRVQYSYGRGVWDEWWVMDFKGAGKWVSTDEGDVAIEEGVELDSEVPAYDALAVGNPISLTIEGQQMSGIVAEKNRCEMVGAAGELPFQIIPNEAYDYADILLFDKRIVTFEYFKDGANCYFGQWVDPFDIKGFD